jgi:hypothetical protein
MSAPRSEARLADLSFPGQLLVWAARQWIRIRDPNERSALRLAEAFERVGAPRALAHLDAALGLLATRARRGLDFRGPGDLELGEDEHRLVRVLETRQPLMSSGHDCDCARRADGIVRDWVAPAACGALQRHLDGLAAEFAAAGLRLTCAKATSRVPAPGPATRPGLRLHGLLLAGLAAVLATGGIDAAHAGPAARAAPARVAVSADDHAHAVWVCRFWKGGRINRRLTLSPDHPSIAACVDRRRSLATGASTDTRRRRNS